MECMIIKEETDSAHTKLETSTLSLDIFLYVPSRSQFIYFYRFSPGSQYSCESGNRHDELCWPG